MESQNINLYKEANKKTEVFLFHIQRKALNFFCRSINNKSFMLYLLCLELSNRKGFCRLNTKDLAKTFKVTAKSICNWLKEIHNNNYITAYYNPHKHYWKVRVNTKRHYELWKKFDGEEMPNSQFSDDDINDILNVLDGKPKENEPMADKKAPNVAKNVDNASASAKNDSTDSLTAQGIFGLAESLIENPNALYDIADKTLNHNDNSSTKSEMLEAPRNENAENLDNANDSSHSSESNDDLDSDSIENSENEVESSAENEPQSQESQDSPSESSQSQENQSNENESDSEQSETNSNENSSESQDGGNEMSAMNEMTKDEEEDFDLEETSKKIQAFMERFNFGVNQTRSERNENQKVLIVTPYKTFISDDDSDNSRDADNIAFTLEMIETLEKNERERISYYVGQPISPIKRALRNAKARIRAKKITAQSEINKIMQTTLNKIDFLKELENENIDSVSIWCINHSSLKEIQDIQQKAESLNKRVNLNFMSYLNEGETQMRLDQIKRGIDDPYFYMTRPKASDLFNEFAFDVFKKPMQPAQDAKNNADNDADTEDAEIEKGAMNESVETPAEAEVS